MSSTTERSIVKKVVIAGALLAAAIAFYSRRKSKAVEVSKSPKRIQAEPDAFDIESEVSRAVREKTKQSALQTAQGAVLVESVPMPEGSPTVSGYDFNQGVDFQKLMESMKTTGFQATNVGLAIDEINRMIRWRLSDEPEEEEDPELRDPRDRSKVKATIFLGYTSNMISCGVREVIKFLVQHKMVDYVVTTGGGIEEDIMKCFNPHYMGDFKLKGSDLRKIGRNRIGNLLVPNENYCSFENFLTPLLTQMLKEQKEQGTVWSPSKIIDRLGKEIDNEDSVYYWCHKNKIPVLCPAITDGSVGDMIFFHSYQHPGLVVDLVHDIKLINDAALMADKAGVVILGGGVVKHHILNANLMRNGTDFAVFVNTGVEFDGSDSGASPDEAVSWGKIRATCKPVKISGEASFIFPLLVSQTWAKHFHDKKALEAER